MGHSRGASLADPDIHRSFDNAQRFLEEAHHRFAAASVGFLVLRLPSKEVVLREWLRRRAVTPESEFDQVVRNEIELSRAFAGLLQESGITYHDMLPALVDGLEAAIRRDEPFYRPNDGHPLEFGYQVYADAAIEALRRMHTQQRNR